MSFHRQFEDQIAHDVSANGTTTLHDRDIMDFQSHRVVGFFGEGLSAAMAGMWQLFHPTHMPRPELYNDHDRHDVSRGPAGGHVGTGYF